MKFDERDLRKKGWNEEELNHARKIIGHAHQKKIQNHKYRDQAIYWVLFVLVISSIIAGLYFLRPILVGVKPIGAYIIIGLIGLVFGTIAGILVKDIEDLEKHHHLIISAIIPITAIISSIITAKEVVALGLGLGIIVEIHPIILGLVFSVCTLIPYAIFIWLEEKKKK